MSLIKEFKLVFIRGLIFPRERSSNPIITGVYEYIDDITFLSSEYDKINLKKDFNAVKKDFKKGVKEYKKEYQLAE